MHFGLASYSLALLAGLLSTLSPCVLPIVPILLGSAMNAHRRAPIALAAGLAISYATIGTALAWAGAALPIVILGYISRSAMVGVRGRLLQAGRVGKVALGSAMLLIAIATISGRDRQAEAWLVNHSPAWLTNFTTRF